MSALDGEPFISEDGTTVHAELWYPRNDDRPKQIRVGLVDVRAADDLVLRYDFDRDGWAIFQDETRQGDGVIDVARELVEVAFIPAWNMPEEAASDA